MVEGVARETRKIFRGTSSTMIPLMKVTGEVSNVVLYAVVNHWHSL